MAQFVDMSSPLCPILLYPIVHARPTQKSPICRTEAQVREAGQSLPPTACLVLYDSKATDGVVKYLLSSSCTHIATVSIDSSKIIDVTPLIQILAGEHSGVVTLIVKNLYGDFIQELTAFLKNMPPHSRLQQIVLHGKDSWFLKLKVWKGFIEALQSPSCKVDGLVLHNLNAKDSMHVATCLQLAGCKVRCLRFSNCRLPEEGINMLARMSLSRLSEVSFCGSQDLSDNSEVPPRDIARCLIDGEGVRLLAEALPNRNCQLRELILLVREEDTSHLQACMPHLDAALRSPHCQLEVLRLFSFSRAIDDNLITSPLSEALESENCNLRVLELDSDFQAGIGDDGLQRLLQALRQPHGKLQCLKVHGNFSSEGIACLAAFLCSNDCQLRHMAVHNDDPTDAAGAELRLAEALQENLRMQEFIYLSGGDRGAEARASSLLQRKPDPTATAVPSPNDSLRRPKLFLCCHEAGGKTCWPL